MTLPVAVSAAARTGDPTMSEVSMYLKYDPEADAAYLYLRPRDRDMRTSMTVPVDTTDTGRMINLDFDDAYRLVGIEIMDASATLAGSGLITENRC